MAAHIKIFFFLQTGKILVGNQRCERISKVSTVTDYQEFMYRLKKRLLPTKSNRISEYSTEKNNNLLEVKYIIVKIKSNRKAKKTKSKKDYRLKRKKEKQENILKKGGEKLKQYGRSNFSLGISTPIYEAFQKERK